MIDNVGASVSFVTGYVSFAMIDVPSWVCYCVIAFGLGLLRTTWAFWSGVAFLVSIALWDLLSDFFSGLHGHVNLRFVSLFGVCLAAACFIVARRLRGGRSETSHISPTGFSMGVSVVALIGTLAVSVYGWWLIGLNRQAGIEIQEWFAK